MPSKKLPVRLPPDHPIWKIPPGKRSARAREAIDLAFNLVEHITEIKGLVVSLNSRLERIEGMLVNGVSVRHAEIQTREPEIDFDIDAFTEL